MILQVQNWWNSNYDCILTCWITKVIVWLFKYVTIVCSVICSHLNLSNKSNLSFYSYMNRYHCIHALKDTKLFKIKLSFRLFDVLWFSTDFRFPNTIYLSCLNSTLFVRYDCLRATGLDGWDTDHYVCSMWPISAISLPDLLPFAWLQPT